MKNDKTQNLLCRREFAIRVSLAATALLANELRGAIQPIQRPGGPRLKIALNAYSFSRLLNDRRRDPKAGMSLLDLVDFCARQNFDALDATGYFFSTYPDPPEDSELNALKRRAFDSGVDICGTGVRNNFTTTDKSIRAAAVVHIKQWVEVAAKLGAPVLRVFADTQMRAQTWQTLAPGRSREQVEEWIADHLRDCAEHAGKFGVIIGVQNHGDFLRTGQDQLNLLKRVDSPWCGAIVDTGYYQTEDPYVDMELVTPYAVNWQIKESPYGVSSDISTDLKRLLTIARMAGYRGYLPIETLSAPGKEYDPFQVVPKFLAELRGAIAATADIAPPLKPEPPRPKPRAGSGKKGSRDPNRKPPNRKTGSRKTPNRNKGKSATKL
jgi:sugar phosphate isomerase/epimerase